MKNYVEIAKRTLQLEAEAINNIIQYLGDDFNTCIEDLLEAKGRIIVSGIGKSANIAQKIVATFNSTGAPSIFMHAADAVHGDLGIIQKDDIVICISNSGNTPEIKVLTQFISRFGNKIIAITGNETSHLATISEHLLLTKITQEACPNNLAPTCSTTAQLAMGDALAVCLLEAKNFGEADFAKYHPGGSLGKKLYLTLREMLPSGTPPQVTKDTKMSEVIIEITSNRLGAVAVVDNDLILGIITDGDIRRMIQNNQAPGEITAGEIMNESPHTAEADQLAVVGVKAIREHNISQLIVVDNSSYVGIVHFHDFMKEGLL